MHHHVINQVRHYVYGIHLEHGHHVIRAEVIEQVVDDISESPNNTHLCYNVAITNGRSQLKKTITVGVLNSVQWPNQVNLT